MSWSFGAQVGQDDTQNGQDTAQDGLAETQDEAGMGIECQRIGSGMLGLWEMLDDSVGRQQWRGP